MPRNPSSLTKLVIAALTVSLAPLASVNAARYSGWYYGNWGGPNYGSGTPVDRLDAACREHDLAYKAANELYGPRFRDASVLRRPAIRGQWIAAYVRANNQLRDRARNLPFLRINPDGTDTWGGGTAAYGRQSIPAGVAFRNSYRVGVEGWPFYMPPF